MADNTQINEQRTCLHWNSLHFIQTTYKQDNWTIVFLLTQFDTRMLFSVTIK